MPPNCIKAAPAFIPSSCFWWWPRTSSRVLAREIRERKEPEGNVRGKKRRPRGPD